MNILAIDSITPVLSVYAAGPAGKTTLTVTDGGQHAEKILELVDKALATAGFSARETTLAVCAEGPGSFTGLRLAYAAAKAVQLASGCPLFPVAPLPCYALSFMNWPGAVISVLDAKKNRFYAQFFRRANPVTEALDIGADEALKFLDPEERILVTGPDAALFAEELRQQAPTLDITAIPSGVNGIADSMGFIAELQFPYYTESVPDHAGPVYVRKSDAEIQSAR
jgi:tRNA threonylcarbamoyladenosine biosynthesis protein TsaB